MHKLILLRHGESDWNRENRFTGWTDVDLSATGIEEARRSGRILRDKGFTFDVAYTSVLKRAIRTLWSVLDEMDLMWIPVYRSWRLNERHYGALQGLNKAETAEKSGEDLAAQLRGAPSAADRGRCEVSRPRSAIPRAQRGAIAANGMPERHRSA